MGGLTVYKAVRRLLPGEDVIYFGDTARVPYGTKSGEAVVSFSREIAGYLGGLGIKLMIVACNTASSVALPAVRKAAGVPVIGVIEPGVSAALAVSGGRILVIGTAATVASGAYTKAIRARMPSARVTEKACPLFVPLVEEGWCAKKVTSLVVSEYLGPLKGKGFDSLILGCTHYPLLKTAIRRELGGKINIIDSAEAVAAEAASALAAEGLSARGGAGRTEFVVSDSPEKFRRLARRLLGIDAGEVRVHRF